jgi:hypothetical protein
MKSIQGSMKLRFELSITVIATRDILRHTGYFVRVLIADKMLDKLSPYYSPLQRLI